MDHPLPLPIDAPRMAPLGRLPVVAAAHLTLIGGLAWAWLVIAGAAPGSIEALVCATPALLALGLGFSSQADRQQYVARLLACAAMLPILLIMWAGAQDAPATTPAMGPLARRPWIFFSAFALLHSAAFVGAIVWLAAAVTRVEAVAGGTPVPATLLVQRLHSLAAAGVPLDVTPGTAADEWVVALRLVEAERAHRVLLRIDERAHTVHVRERLGASGAAPRSADEASLRSIGDPAFDPTRPDAQQISSRVAQASMIDPARLQATRLVLREGQAEPAPQALARTSADPDALVTLLCALVIRSGYAWQPQLGLGRGR